MKVGAFRTSERYGHIILPIYSQKKSFALSDPALIRHPANESARYVIPPHFHEDIELIAVTDGAMHMIIDGDERLVQAGDVVMAAPFTVHEAYIDNAADSVRYCYFTANCRLLCPNGDRGMLALLAGARLSVTAYSNDASLSALICRMPALYRQQDGSGSAECAMMLLFYQIIDRMRRLGCFSEKSDTDEAQLNFMRKAMEFLEEHYTSEVTWKLVQAHFPYNQSYFCRLWKQHFGKPFFQSLAEFRIRKAIRICSESETPMKISEIASAVGFTDYSRFSHTFQRLIGMSPSEYMKARGSRTE